MPDEDLKRAGQAARRAIAKAGGLVGTAELRARLGSVEEPLSADRIKDLVGEVGFPDAVYPAPGEDRPGVRKLWLAADVDRWWSARQRRAGRRGPKPRQVKETEGGDV